MRDALEQAGFAARCLCAALVFVAVAAAQAQDFPPGSDALLPMPGARAEDPESRVGAQFWCQPKARPFSVDFFETPEIDARVRLDGTRRFVVTALTRAGAKGDGALIYQVRFGPGENAFILVDGFEAQLYVDPPPQSVTRLKSDLYLSPEAYFFSLKTIFSEDPETLWEQIRTLGPTYMRPAPTPGRPPVSPKGNKR